MALYDDFAWFYNRYWNEEFHSLAFPILERIWLPRVAPKGRVLDVCCGTGYLAGLLTSRGYRVTGIDASAEMIAHARENVPTAAFQVADASAFRVLGKFDGAVSTFDSLNHILSEEDLQAVLSTHGGGAEAGRAVCLRHAAGIRLPDRTGRTPSPWCATTTCCCSPARASISGRAMAQCRITMFRLLDGEWRRSDVEVHERCYTTKEIDAALSHAGFEQTECYDARDLGMSGQLGQGRTFVVTTRSTAPLRRDRSVEAQIVAQVGAHHAIGHADVIAQPDPRGYRSNSPAAAASPASIRLTSSLAFLRAASCCRLCQAKAS